MRKQESILILGFALCALNAAAQRRKPAAPQPQAPIRATRSDTTIKGTTLEVYQVYQPELKPIVKPELSPTLPPVAKEPTPQQYEVPQQTLNYSYSALPLRPLALGRDTATPPSQNYALLAGGNLSTMLAEAGLGGLRGRNWNASVQGRYISQEGATLENQIYRSFSLRGTGSYRTEGHILEAGLSGYRNVFGRYGYNHDALHYNLEDVRMPYSAANLALGAQNRQPGPWNIDYHPQLSIGAFDARQGHEKTVNVYLPATKRLDSSLSISLAINGQFAWTAIGSITGSNHILQLLPALDYNAGGFNAHIGVSPTVGEGERLMALPDIRLRYVLADGKLSFGLNWQGQRIQNTLQQITRNNPYVFPYSSFWMQTMRHEVIGSATLALGRHMSVWARGGWQRQKELPLFVATTGGDEKDFSILYEPELHAIVWGGGICYIVGEGFSLGAEGNWYNFYKHASSRVWGEPAVRLKGYASLRITDGLLVTAYAEILDKIWGRNAAGQDVEQRGVFDLGAAGEYTFGSRFSVLLRAENLLGRKNERWLGYPSFGFNIYGGLRFRF